MVVFSRGGQGRGKKGGEREEKRRMGQKED
jgi:hypothetical protein